MTSLNSPLLCVYRVCRLLCSREDNTRVGRVGVLPSPLMWAAVIKAGWEAFVVSTLLLHLMSESQPKRKRFKR